MIEKGTLVYALVGGVSEKCRVEGINTKSYSIPIYLCTVLTGPFSGEKIAKAVVEEAEYGD